MEALTTLLRRENKGRLEQYLWSMHAADLLRMVGGESQPERAAGLDAYLVTVSDHGLNASTFTARVIASTGSDAVSAVVGCQTMKLDVADGKVSGRGNNCGAPGEVNVKGTVTVSK